MSPTGRGADSRWIAYLDRRPAARVRLYCFPFAGGGATVYRGWPRDLPPDVEVWPVQLPGREGRIQETPFDHVEPLVAGFLEAMEDDLGGGRSFALFGHSMGTLLVYEVARALRRQGRSLPVHLFVSAHRAPHRPLQKEPVHALPHGEFRDRLRRLNGTPEAVLEHPELMELLEPVLRADFKVTEAYEHRPGEPLDLPLTAYGGRDDPDVGEDDLAAWGEQVSGRFRVQTFPGDHFYLNHQPGEALRHSLARELLASLG